MKKVIVITGASSGIGEMLKKYYETAGAVIVNLSLGIENEDENNINLDVSNKKDREELKHIINNRMDNPEIVKKGYWRGQKED